MRTSSQRESSVSDRDDLSGVVAELASWERVSIKHMFGTNCLMVNNKMFAFASPGGLVVKLPDATREQALALQDAAPYDHSGRGAFGNWVQFKGASSPELAEWARHGYEFVESSPAPKRRSRARRGTSK